MKQLPFHLIYLVLIAILGVQNWQQKKALDLTAASLASVDTSMRASNRILREVGKNKFYKIQKNVRAYANPINVGFLEKAEHTDSLSEEYQIRLNKEIMYLDSTQNTTYFSSEKIQTLRNYISDFSKSLLNLIQDPKDRNGEERQFAIRHFANNDSFWQSLTHKTTHEARLQLTIFQNLIESDKLQMLNYISQKVGGSPIHESRFLVSIIPKKAVIVEGEAFEGQVYIIDSYPLSSSNVEVLANGKTVFYKNGKAFLSLPNQAVGTKKLELEARAKNLLTGQVEITKSEFEYEVFPKCSRNCQ